MDESTNIPLPKLALRALSGHVADLLLVGVGEQEAVRHRPTRLAWHAFFFSTILFVSWHVLARLIVIPSLGGGSELLPKFRLIEAFCYSGLIVLLGTLTCCHYSFVILASRQARFVTIGFFFLAAVLLFARLYYSLFHVDNSLFRWTEATHVPLPTMGINGVRDIVAFAEFVIFSAGVMLNCSYSTITSNSLLVSSMAVVQAVFGYFFVAVLVGTFVQVSSEHRAKRDG